MENIEQIKEFEKNKSKVMNYIIYKKRSEYEVKNKFSQTIEQEMREAAKSLNFERAMELRDILLEMKANL